MNEKSKVEALWEEFGDVPMNPETECIEEPWNGFPGSLGTPDHETLAPGKALNAVMSIEI